jgi:ABC-type protease/lipase transport system fused ATPase/permease subunit
MLSEGRMQAFGPRDEVLRRVIAPAPDVTNETNLSQEAGQVAS